MAKRILILEHDEEIKTILKNRLTDMGYEVHCPVDSYVAIEYLQHHDVNLIILNDEMPLINGKDILALLDECHIQIPAIVFLSKFQSDDRYANRSQCICFHKPFQFDDLVTKASHLLNT